VRVSGEYQELVEQSAHWLREQSQVVGMLLDDDRYIPESLVCMTTTSGAN